MAILKEWTLHLWKSHRIDHIGSNQNKISFEKKEKQQLSNEHWALNIAHSWFSTYLTDLFDKFCMRGNLVFETNAPYVYVNCNFDQILQKSSMNICAIIQIDVLISFIVENGFFVILCSLIQARTIVLSLESNHTLNQYGWY